MSITSWLERKMNESKAKTLNKQRANSAAALARVETLKEMLVDGETLEVFEEVSGLVGVTSRRLLLSNGSQSIPWSGVQSVTLVAPMVRVTLVSGKVIVLFGKTLLDEDGARLLHHSIAGHLS